MKSDYDTLTELGFSPVKATEIVLDAQRGDEYAALWLSFAKEVLNQGEKP